MPSVSKKQHNFMAAIAKNPAFAKKVGIKPSVGEEFLKADKGRKFGTGGGVGITRGGKGQINKQESRYGSIYGYEKNVPNVNLNKYEGKKEGGAIMAKEKMHSEKSEMKMDTAQDKKLIKRAFKMHDAQEHKGGKGTNLAKLRKGGMAMKKAKRYGDGGEIETETEQGQNKNIGDDVRARAMAALESGKMDKEVEAPKAKAKAPSFADKAKKAGFTSAETKGGAALMTRKMASGGKVRGCGIASKGLTKGKMV